MSRRKNGTLRAGARLGLNPYGWGNGRGQAMRAMKKAPPAATGQGHKGNYSRSL